MSRVRKNKSGEKSGFRLSTQSNLRISLTRSFLVSYVSLQRINDSWEVCLNSCLFLFSVSCLRTSSWSNVHVPGVHDGQPTWRKCKWDVSMARFSLLLNHSQQTALLSQQLSVCLSPATADVTSNFSRSKIDSSHFFIQVRKSLRLITVSYRIMVLCKPRLKFNVLE